VKYVSRVNWYCIQCEVWGPHKHCWICGSTQTVGKAVPFCIDGVGYEVPEPDLSRPSRLSSAQVAELVEKGAESANPTLRRKLLYPGESEATVPNTLIL